MKVLVTGAAGFIGSTLSERLLRAGHHVVGIDAITDYYESRTKRENVSGLMSHPRFELIESDLIGVNLASILSGVEIIFHQAGQPGVRKSWGSEFQKYTRANVDATQQLLEAATLESSIRKFVYASSSSVYGDAERYPTAETDVPQPVSPYGVTKLAGEHLVSLYGKRGDLETVSLRYFTVYGPRQRPDMAFTRFIRAILQDEAISIFGTGEQIRDFTFVHDIVEANLAAAAAQGVSGRVFNVAGGSSVTVNEVISTLERITGRFATVERSQRVAGDVFRTGADVSAAAQFLNWVATTELEEGLAAQVRWMEGILAQESAEKLKRSKAW